jgi:transcriptional regulator with XRE-family HTH domain
MKASEWIDRVKLERGWETDYRAAQELGITRSLVSQYKTGKVVTLDSDVTLIVAEALGIDPMEVLADQAMEKSKNEKARSAWRASLARFGHNGRAAILALGVTGVLSALPQESQANTGLSTLADPPLCIM